jgi:hypothetical protein
MYMCNRIRQLSSRRKPCDNSPGDTAAKSSGTSEGNEGGTHDASEGVYSDQHDALGINRIDSTVTFKAIGGAITARAI